MDRLSISFLLNESSNINSSSNTKNPVIEVCDEETCTPDKIRNQKTQISSLPSISPVIQLSGNPFVDHQEVIKNPSSFHQILQNKVEKAMRVVEAPKSKPYGRKAEVSEDEYRLFCICSSSNRTCHNANDILLKLF